MEQFNLPFEKEAPPESVPAGTEEREDICPTCGMPRVEGICNCNRPWTGPVRSPFKRSKRTK